MKISKTTLSRLIVYRKILNNLIYDGVTHIFSRKLATISGSTPEQVRNDLMVIGYNGTPSRGYNVSDLEKSLGEFIDNPEGEKVCIVGLGKLGTQLYEYCYWRYQNLASIIAFDSEPEKVKKYIKNVEVYHIDEMTKIIRKENIKVAILCVPSEIAQSVALELVEAGIKGILNYTPTFLKTDDKITVENLDMIMSLEKLSYISRS
jgi:redox-sensing transcriptional repressor